MRYDRVWSKLARRALAHAEVDLQTVLGLAAEQGMSDAEIARRMLADLDNDGPVFGKLLRGLQGTAAASVKAATNQGEAMMYAAQDEALRSSQALRGMQGSILDAIDRGDAEVGAIIETEVIAEVDHTWVCTLVNTCHLCLPLHGTRMPLRDFQARGLSPDTIHQQQGWESSCKCKLVPSRHVEGYAELVEPLRRQKLPKGGRRTQRLIAQVDTDKARAAAADAMQTPEGRAALRKLGKSGGA